MGIKDETYSSAEWFLTVLSTINPDHEFYGKSYTPLASDSKYTRSKKKLAYSNDDGFFTGLPIKQQKTNQGRLPIREIIQPPVEEATDVIETSELRELRRQLEKCNLYKAKKSKQLRVAEARARQSGAILGAAAAGSFFAPMKKTGYLSTANSSGTSTPTAEQESSIRMNDQEPVINPVPFTV